MTSSPFLLALHAHLPEDAFSWVVAALMNDPLVWEALQGDLGPLALQRLGQTPTAWQPAALAQLALEIAPAGTEEPALPPGNLAEAARLAPLLAQFYREHQGWEGVLDLLQPDPRAWQTPLACAVTTVPEAAALLRALSQTREGILAVLHALLSQPLPPERHAAHLAGFLREVAPAQRFCALRLLAERRPELASAIIAHLPDDDLPQPYRSWQQALVAAARGMPEQAADALDAAWEAARLLRGRLAIHRAYLAEQQDDVATALAAWEQAAQVLPDRPAIAARRILALHRVRHTEDALALLPAQPEHPALAVAAAVLRRADDPEAARDLACAAWKRRHLLPDDLLRRLAETLLALDCPDQAAEAALALAQRRPVDLAALDLAAETALAARHPQAVSLALWAYHRAPTTVRLRRLAAAEELAGLWAVAFSHRQRLAQEPQAVTEDHLALARLALRLDAGEEALQAARKVLAHEPQHPGALTILGEVALREGRLRAAQEHLRAALAQNPTEASPYLLLADLLRRTEGAQAAVKLLQDAVHALPRDAEVHYRLGMCFLELQRPAHARPVLEKAHRLAPHRAEIAHALAQALLALGEAQPVIALLQPWHERAPSPATARLLARAHMVLEQPEEAAVLLSPLQHHPEATAEDLLAYAQALLASQADPEHVVHVLEDALARLSQADAPALCHADILHTLAQAQRARGQDEEALAAYRRALRLLPPGHPRRQERIVLGLAETALRCHRPEVALAALEDILQHQPDHLPLRRLQAEAYRALGFRAQAIDAGAEVLRLARHEPQTVLWYARLLTDMGEPERAAAVLEPLLATHPLPEAALLLARLYRALARPEDALAALAPLLARREEMSPAWCAAVGEELSHLGRHAAAVACLRQAVHAGSAPLAWHLALVRALQAQEAFAEATQAATTALRHAAQDGEEDLETRLALHLAVVHNALAQGDEHQAALALRQALETYPSAAALLRAAVSLWRVLGNLPAALQSAQAYLRVQPDDLSVRLHAVHLANALLQPDEALALVSDLPAPVDAPSPELQHLYTARAEVALARGEEVAAADALARARQCGPETAWMLALQARLTAGQVDGDAGRAQLAAAREALPAGAGETPPPPAVVGAWGAVADTAAALGVWDVAASLAERVAQACPFSPAAALRLARLAVLRVESHHRSRALEARAGRLPTDDALAAARQQWQEGLLRASERLGVSPEAGYRAHPLLHRWFARGEAAFSDRVLPVLQEQPAEAGDVAAVLDVLRRRTAPPIALAADFRQHPLVQLHQALLLERCPQGDDEEALRLAEQARRARPSWAEAHFLVARLSRRLGRLAEARDAVAAALRLVPDEPRWHALAAEIAADLQDAQGALTHLRQALRLEPNYLPHHLALARAHMAADDLAAARRTLEAALTYHEDAPALHLLLAQTLFRLGDLDAAAAHAEQAMHRDRGDPAPLMLRIRIALAQNDPRTALKYAHRWLRSHPHDPEAVRYAAQAYMALEDEQPALALVEAALQRHPDDLALGMLRAELHTRLHGGAAAVPLWQHLLAAHAEHPALWLGLAEALAQARQSAEAHAAAHQALRRADDLSREEQVRLHLLLGNLARDAGQLDQALHHFGEAVRRAPAHGEALLKLAQVQNERGDYAQALATLQVLQKLMPEDSRPFYLAGLIYKALRDYEAAEKMFRKAAQRDPADFRIRRQLTAVSVINLFPS